MPQRPEAMGNDERDKVVAPFIQCRNELVAGHIGVRGEHRRPVIVES
jgi:hypothetical protein